MRDAVLKWLFPICDRILLILFVDSLSGSWDAELLRNDDPALMISRNPEMKKAGYSVPEDITRELKRAIDAAYRPLSPDAVTVTVELDTEVSNGIRSWCGEYSGRSQDSLTPEKLIEALGRFAALPENRELIRAWLEQRLIYGRAVRENFYTVTREELIGQFDEILDKIHAGRSPALVVADGKPDLLVFDWEDYWRRFGILEPPGEKERIEELCRQKWEQEQAEQRSITD